MVDKISKVETYCLQLPYRKQINFRSVSETTGAYLVVRIRTKDGAEGVSECVSRPRQAGENPELIARQIESFFAPMMIGRNPLDHNAILQDLSKIKGGYAAQSLLDVALWDIKGKIMGQPVWRLLGGGPAKPVKVSWLVHGDTAPKMVKEAVEKVERGFRSLKIKVWKRSIIDVHMIRDVRKAVGDDIVIYVDANGAYTESEARTILTKLADYNVSFIEEPCHFATPDRMAMMARDLPIPILADQCYRTLEDIQSLIKINAVGAVSVKLHKSGITESLKIIAACQGAGLPMVIGTNSESRLGSMARIHLRTALPSLEPWPTETHFFEKLADDVFSGEFEFKDGALTVPDKPGFGASLDAKKLKKYAA